MSSYNNIRKIKYTKCPSDGVSLQEYIMFEDTRAKEKYVVFKFLNNVNQRIFGFRFEVLQYNASNELIEKSVVVHKDFVAEANEPFVPVAKLKVNFDCQSIEVNLESATFDRVAWSNGEFTDSPYSFESYANTVTKSEQRLPVANTKKKVKEKKKLKFGFNVRRIFRKNRAVFPAVFNVILCIIFVGLIIGSTFYFKSSTGAFAVDNFVVKKNSDTTVTILDYSGDSDKIEIPSKLGNYDVTVIAKGAFTNSSIKSVTIKTEKSLTIATNAFKDCSTLTAVAGVDCGTVMVMSGAFTNCSKLISFNVPTAWLTRKCFDGTNNIKVLRVSGVIFSGETGKLLDIFNGVKTIKFDELAMEEQFLTDKEFTDGVTW